jgi:LPXTG-site transpeptidase (sortase) family protein
MTAVAVPRPRRRGVGLLGALLVLVGIVGAAYPLYWNHHSQSGGNALIARAFSAIANPKSASCSSSVASAVTPTGSSTGVLEIPSLGLVAPVSEGLSDAVLAVAVGHDPAAPWPGLAGESVLEAHDVSYFAGLDHIHSGAIVNWVTPCGSAKFVVTATAVRAPGDFIATPPGGAGLALVTCYPTDALFWTNQRFVVTTRLVQTVVGAHVVPRSNPSGPTLTVPAPPSLVAQNLTLAANESLISLHILKIAGTPALSWQEGPGPIRVESNALAAFFGAEKAVTRGNATWWRALAPGLPMPTSWPSFGSVDVTITIAGSTPSAITLSGSGATMRIAVVNDTLHIVSLS